eukprot:TRINITY_DN16474_c0_g1_i1.p1 TRINITY_DN16474_c0_g1~~TRINITY_DN16474_c0_g1_i1.p1  ORF type:complete len:276 (-),score=50.56 TRINITY_DN16474_c0_g1_i1:38-808(-)
MAAFMDPGAALPPLAAARRLLPAAAADSQVQVMLPSRPSASAAGRPMRSRTLAGLWQALLGSVCAVAVGQRRRRQPVTRALHGRAAGSAFAAASSLCCRLRSFAGCAGAGRSQIVQRRVYDDDNGDQPDAFFEKPPGWRPKVEPAWKGTTSPSKVRMGNPVTFFFPTKDRKDSEHDGMVNPKMYKKIEPSKKAKHRKRRLEKRAWRKMSNRLQSEWRFKRYPRDESGKVTPGEFGGKRGKHFTELRGASPAMKKKW